LIAAVNPVRRDPHGGLGRDILINYYARQARSEKGTGNGHTYPARPRSPGRQRPAGRDDSPITWPAETDLSIMGRDRGTYDVMGPGGVPCSPDFSIMGRDRGTYDVMAPGGV